MKILHTFLTHILHLDHILPVYFSAYGTWIFAGLFVIIFLETGLIITPFLPGDSLLFATGALLASTSIPWWIIALLLSAAAILGDGVNYAIGRFFGKTLSKIRLINPSSLEKAHDYFDTHGSRAIILARFIPIIRTFVPFVAGVSTMSYSRFMVVNSIGGLVWIHLFLASGYYFGRLSWVKTHFSHLILGIIVVSFLPLLFDIIQSFMRRSNHDSKN